MDVVEVPDRLEVTVGLEATIGADTAVARCNPKELAAMAGATEVYSVEVVMVAVEDSRPHEEVMEEPEATVEEVMTPGVATASREAVMHHVELREVLREVLREEVREEVDVLLELTAVAIAVLIRTENMKKN